MKNFAFQLVQSSSVLLEFDLVTDFDRYSKKRSNPLIGHPYLIDYYIYRKTKMKVFIVSLASEDNKLKHKKISHH